MADRVYPNSGKPVPAPAPATTTNPTFPATKAQLYNASRPAYRPQPPPRRRSLCCSCCLWTTFAFILLLLLAAIAAAVLYLLYRPHRPTFSVNNLQISQFNLSSTSHLSTKLSLSLLARNPNKKITFFYNPTSLDVSTAGTSVGSGSFPAFTLPTKNTTILRAKIASSSKIDDSTSLRSDLKRKKTFPIIIEMNTKARLKIGGVKTKKVRVRVMCSGIKASVPTGKSPSTAVTSGAKCKVDLRVKIWKWTF